MLALEQTVKQACVHKLAESHRITQKFQGWEKFTSFAEDLTHMPQASNHRLVTWGGVKKPACLLSAKEGSELSSLSHFCRCLSVPRHSLGRPGTRSAAIRSAALRGAAAPALDGARAGLAAAGDGECSWGSLRSRRTLSLGARPRFPTFAPRRPRLGPRRVNPGGGFLLDAARVGHQGR